MPDDYSANARTTGSVKVGGTAAGNIETRRDIDWFAVELVAGRTYVIDLEGADSGGGTLADTVLRGLYDKDGKRIADTRSHDGGAGDDARLTFTATEGGTYYIAARGHGTETGTYTVRVTQHDSDSQASGARDLGDITDQTRTASVRDTVNGGDDGADYFRFTLSEAKKVKLNLRNQDANADLYLEDGNGTVLYSSTTEGTGNEGIAGTLLAGTWYVRVAAREAGENSYALRYRVADPESVPEPTGTDFSGDTSTQGRLSVGGSVTGTVLHGNDRDWFAVELEGGKNYRIDLKGKWTGDGTLHDPYVRGIYDANGAYLAWGRDDGGMGLNSRAFFTPKADGTYYLEATAAPYGAGGGTYVLSVAELTDDFAADTGTEGRFSVGTPGTGRIETPQDFDWFAVELEAGKTYRVDLNGEKSDNGWWFNPYLGGIHDAEGTLLPGTTNDNTNGGTDFASRAYFTPGETGTYYVAAGSSPGSRDRVRTGDYTVSATEITDDFGAGTDTTGTVSVGGSARGNAETPGDRDWFAVELEAGKTYQIEIRGLDFPGTTLWDYWIRGGIHDGDGQFIDGTGFSVPGNSNLVTFLAPDSGTYYVAAGSHDYVDATGTYTVHVAEFDADSVLAGARDLGDITKQSRKASVKDAVNDADDWADYFRFTLSEAKVVKLALRKQDANADLYLEDALGDYLSSSTRDGTASEEIDEALPAGTYYVRVAAREAGENDYALRYQVADVEDAM